MLSLSIFGKYVVSPGTPSVSSYIVPAHLTADMMKLISFENNEIRIHEEIEVHNEEVTHESFFGENIQRVKNSLRK